MLDTLPLEAATRVDSAVDDSAFYDPKLSGDVVESDIDTGEHMSFLRTELRNPGDIVHLNLDEIVRRNYDVCPVWTEFG
jgi:hypothetical protein